MRVTRIPGDFNDIGDKPCRVYLNEVEIADWIVADDFRRAVETTEGARFGSVRVDLAPDAIMPQAEAPAPVQEAAEVREVKVAKPNIHIPARKRKANK